MKRKNTPKKYDIIYSIGHDCSCSLYMIKAKLRACSGPFDWLTNADCKSRFELMLNDFEDFLKKDDLVLMPKPTLFPVSKNNDYYKNIKNDLYFWHDFPADKTFEEAYPEIKQKYDRRIKRFYQNIGTKKRVLLVWFSKWHNTPDDVVVNLCGSFCKKMNKDIDFLFIEHKEGAYIPKHYALSNNITRYYLHAKTFETNGIPTTLGNEELVLPIFLKYKLITPWYTDRRFLLKFFIRFICLFIPIKKWRKNFRNFTFPQSKVAE